jgi:hypothetical protein
MGTTKAVHSALTEVSNTGRSAVCRGVGELVDWIGSASGVARTVCSDAANASAPVLAVASDSANACHPDRRCGSVSDAIPLSQILNIVGSMPAPPQGRQDS